MNYKTALTNLDLVYPDGVAKGFPLWTEKGIRMVTWEGDAKGSPCTWSILSE